MQVSLMQKLVLKVTQHRVVASRLCMSNYPALRGVNIRPCNCSNDILSTSNSSLNYTFCFYTSISVEIFAKMTTVTIAIVSLKPSITPSTFLTTIKDSNVPILAIGRVVQWIITPTLADYLLAHNWDYMVVLTQPSVLTEPITSLCSHIFSIRLQEKADFVTRFKESNPSLLHPTSSPPPFHNLTHPNPLVGLSTQRVDLTPSLLAFARSDLCPKGAVSMLNFVSFRPYESARKNYNDYIEAFETRVGNKYGGAVKILGDPVEEGEWQEVILAHYASLEHFADMIAGRDYQETNKELRLAHLRDTCILMTTEVELDWKF
jgi:hypothetical protein